MTKIKTLDQVRSEYPCPESLEKRIYELLSAKFIHAKEPAEVIATAICSGQNAILWGPAGHGKSEMVECVLEGLGLWSRETPDDNVALIQSFGEGLTEDALWGGVDFAKLSPQDGSAAEMDYHVENSFINYEVAVMEELFDAPAFCLLPLKHTLQAGFLAKNGRNHPVKTKVIIACTNKNPDEIDEMGETYRALLERFILRLQVRWETYDIDSFSSMMRKHKFFGKKFGEECCNTLAATVVNCINEGEVISPRTAMKSLDVLCGLAKPSNNNVVSEDDLFRLKYVSGFEKMGERLTQEIRHRKQEAAVSKALNTFFEKADEIINKLNNEGIPNKLVDAAVIGKKIKFIMQELKEIECTENFYEPRDKKVDELNNWLAHIKEAVIDLARI